MNKIKLLSVLSFIVLNAIANRGYAQKGELMLYGSLNYHSNNQSGSSFSANPFGAGYFFSNHAVTGINYGFDLEKNGAHQTTSYRHEAGVFYSDSKMIGEHFVIIGQADLHYVWGSALNNTAYAYHYNGYLFRIYPLVGVVLGHGWVLKAKFCELSFQRTKGNNAAKTVDRTVIAGINGSTLGVGVSKNFSFKKHKS